MAASEELIARVRQKDPAALAEFIDAHRRQLSAFIEKQLGDQLRRKVEADDVFQEACAEAVRSLPTVNLTEWDPFSWLCRLAEQRIIDLHRRFFDAQKRDAAREVGLHSPGASGGDSNAPSGGLINLLVASMTTPSQAFSRNAREARLVDALNELPDDQREAIRLRYVENMPSKEIAARLKKSDAAVRVMLTRSLKKLQDLLGDDAPR